MPSGATKKQTLTPYRRGLLQRAAKSGGIHKFFLSNPQRFQMNEMATFGWIVEYGGYYYATESGKETLRVSEG